MSTFITTVAVQQTLFSPSSLARALSIGDRTMSRMIQHRVWLHGDLSVPVIIGPQRGQWDGRLRFAASDAAALLDAHSAAGPAPRPECPITTLTTRGLADTLAQSLKAEHGVGDGTTVALLARNSPAFVESLLGVLRTGADVVLLNTGFAGPQVADVVAAEEVTLLIHDDGFDDLLEGIGVPTLATSQLEEAATAGARWTRPSRKVGRIVMLTSGTTGRPKGAARAADDGAIAGAEAVLGRIPLRLRDTQVIAAPLFHGSGFLHLAFGLARCATTVVSPKFDAQEALSEVSEHHADVLVVVPQMLQRILDLDTDVLLAAQTDRLRIIATGGGPLTATIAKRAHQRFGPVVYNLYGSTEVAAATIATPRDLRSEPATVGRAVTGVAVAVLDDDGTTVPTGTISHVFVGGRMGFKGYTDGQTKQVRRG